MAVACSRCGRVGEIEYGADGLPYCSACIFYGLNRQCWRCRMYLPATELQQYLGQWACPYCIQDMRAEERKREKGVSERPRMDALQYSEKCERCGRDLEFRVYVWNGKNLCKSCLDDEKDKWGLIGGGPMSAPQRISVEEARPAKKKSAIERAISEFLAITGIRKRPVSEIIVYRPKMQSEIKAARPMADAVPLKPMEESGLAKPKRAPDEAKKPQQEDIIRVPGQKPEPGKRKRKGKAKPAKENPGSSGHEQNSGAGTGNQ